MDKVYFKPKYLTFKVTPFGMAWINLMNSMEALYRKRAEEIAKREAEKIDRKMLG